jgi:hypothetical protein
MALRKLIWNTFRSFAHSVHMNRNFRCDTILPRMTHSLNDNLKQKSDFKLLSFSPLSIRKYCTLPGNTSYPLANRLRGHKSLVRLKYT